MIRFFFVSTKPALKKRNQIKSIIKDIVSDNEYVIGEISVIFCNDEYLLDINRKYLQHDYYTDIITFDHTERNIISGDLYISQDRVKENAITYNTTFGAELVRVIFHGILHLVGFDDKDEVSVQIMREKENYYLSKIELNEE